MTQQLQSWMYIYLRKMKTHIHAKTSTQMVHNSIIHDGQSGNHPNAQSFSHQLIKGMTCWYQAPRMGLENITLCEKPVIKDYVLYEPIWHEISRMGKNFRESKSVVVWAEGRKWRMSANIRLSFCGDENVSSLDCADSYTTLGICWNTSKEEELPWRLRR